MVELTSQDLGALGERYVAGLLVMKGVRVEAGGPGDLVAHGDMALEVKTARYVPYQLRSGRRGYRFCVERDEHRRMEADFLVLLCWSEGVLDLPAFIIPAVEVHGRKYITIPNEPERYEGKYARWLNQWELIC